jgi:hypothetical protein
MTTAAATLVPEQALPRLERRDLGRAVRERLPRAMHAAWSPPADRPDPLHVLAQQDATRVPDLVPIRYGRMAVSA